MKVDAVAAWQQTTIVFDVLGGDGVVQVTVLF